MMGTRYEQTWEKVKFEQGKGDDFDNSTAISYLAPAFPTTSLQA